MAVEETFDIELPDSEAEKLVTPALLIEATLRKVQITEQSVCLSRRAFYALRRLLVGEFGCKRNQAKPDAPLESLVPRRNRRAVWLRMKDPMHANRWPKLQRPPWVRMGLLVVFAAGTIGFGIAGISYWAAPVAAIVPWSLALAATQPLCTEFPDSCRTAGQFAHFLVMHAPKLFEPTGRVWTRAEVAETIRRLTVEHLGLKPDQYREDARFVEDLGGG